MPAASTILRDMRAHILAAIFRLNNNQQMDCTTPVAEVCKTKMYVKETEIKGIFNLPYYDRLGVIVVNTKKSFILTDLMPDNVSCRKGTFKIRIEFTPDEVKE